MRKEQAEELLRKYASGTLTDEEIAILEHWHLSHDLNSAPGLSIKEFEHDTDEVWAMLEGEYSRKKQIKLIRSRYAAIAASIILFLSVGIYFAFHKRTSDIQIVQAGNKNIRPGNSKAILHLANGRRIYLTTDIAGELVRQENTSIAAAKGQLVYNDRQLSGNSRIMVYDTIYIPRGGQHQLLLGDGSKVWINTASAIRFPENFYGKERLVELLYGEAYFEVVHMAGKPFIVMTGNHLVEDIGTHFNINAYQDELFLKTTLLEGAVKVTRSGTSINLKPGEQSVASYRSNMIKIGHADLDEAVAWKNGKFIFNNEDIQSIMRKISRWYDVDVIYQDGISGNEFIGSVSRFKSVSEVLRKLEETGTVHFKIEGRRITVMP